MLFVFKDITRLCGMFVVRLDTQLFHSAQFWASGPGLWPPVPDSPTISVSSGWGPEPRLIVMLGGISSTNDLPSCILRQHGLPSPSETECSGVST
jgi:hypothetical protein